MHGTEIKMEKNPKGGYARGQEERKERERWICTGLEEKKEQEQEDGYAPA